MKKTLTGLALIAGLAGCYNPRVLGVKDFTGDGISDVMIRDSRGFEYLFIGQKDSSSFIQAKKYGYRKNEVVYFKTEDGKVYFFDGNFYRESPKEGEKK